jgi:hypothetical protein
MKIRFTGLLLIFFVGLSFVSFATEQYPQRSVIEQDGQQVGFYFINGKRYREVKLKDAERVAKGIGVAFFVKLESLQGQRVLVYTPENVDPVNFKLKAGIILPDSTRGVNLLLAGKKDEAGGRNFIIESVSLMPNDLELFKSKKEILAKKTATAFDYYELGDWIEVAKNHTRIVEDEIFSRYESARDWAHKKGVELEAAELSKGPKEFIALLNERTKYAKEKATSSCSDFTASLLASYRDFSEEFSGFKKDVVEKGTAVSGQTKKAYAQACLRMGAFYEEMFGDNSKAVELYKKAVEFNNELTVAVKKLKKQGIVYVDGTWKKATEIAKEVGEKTSTAAKEVAEKVKEVAEKIETAANLAPASLEGKLDKKTIAGEKYFRSMSDMLYLVSIDKGKGVNELAEMIPSFPEDVARKSVFMCASRYAKDSLPVIEKALLSESNIVRAEAANYLCVVYPEGAEKLIATLKEEKNTAVAFSIIDSMWSLADKRAASLMVAVIREGQLPEKVRKHALQYLVSASGVDFGLDGFAWKRWLGSGMENFKRKEKHVLVDSGK